MESGQRGGSPKETLWGVEEKSAESLNSLGKVGGETLSVHDAIRNSSAAESSQEIVMQIVSQSDCSENFFPLGVQGCVRAREKVHLKKKNLRSSLHFLISNSEKTFPREPNARTTADVLRGCRREET